MDVSRKIILDKLAIERYEGRRIISISTAALEWVDTRLCYTAVVARGSPIITILVFKHNENKLKSLYSINVCAALENPDKLEMNEGQTYTMLPSEVKFSLDAEFLSVICFDGSVKVLKMPAIIDPMQNVDA